MVDRLVDAAMDGAIGLLVADEPRGIDRDAVRHRPLVDRAALVAAKGAGFAQQDGENFGRHRPA